MVTMFRSKLGMFIAAVVVVCVGGLAMMQSGEEGQKDRVAREKRLNDHNMDVEMGELEERIGPVLRSHCRGMSCSTSSGDFGDWFKGSMVHRDVLDVSIPYMHLNKDRKTLRLKVFMRDKSADLAQAEPGIGEAVAGVLALINIPRDALAECQAGNEGAVSGAYGKLTCRKYFVAHYYASNGDPLDGTTLILEAALP
jgi:hypothetical protein